MPTSEIHDANGNYAGYARFNNAGEFQGTFGGYGNGAANRNGGSRVQNMERTVSMRQAARRNRRNA